MNEFQSVSLPDDDEISVQELEDLITQVELFYNERDNPKMNLIWLANLILKRLMLDRDYLIDIEGQKGCLDEETEIITNKGKIKIKDLKSDINKILAYDFKNNKKVFAESLLIDSGEKEVYEITLESGKSVRATLDHTFFILRDTKVIEIKLKDLKVGDNILCKKL